MTSFVYCNQRKSHIADSAIACPASLSAHWHPAISQKEVHAVVESLELLCFVLFSILKCPKHAAKQEMSGVFGAQVSWTRHIRSNRGRRSDSKHFFSPSHFRGIVSHPAFVRRVESRVPVDTQFDLININVAGESRRQIPGMVSRSKIKQTRTETRLDRKQIKSSRYSKHDIAGDDKQREGTHSGVDARKQDVRVFVRHGYLHEKILRPGI